MSNDWYEALLTAFRMAIALVVLHGLYWVMCRALKKNYDGRKSIIIFYILMMLSSCVANLTKGM
jgi:hypothetical protein